MSPNRTKTDFPCCRHALHRLWDRWVERGDPTSPIGWDDLREPSLEAHLNQQLDAIYEMELTPVQQHTAERLFRALADRDAKGRVTRRLLEYASINLPELDAVVKAFRDEERGRTFLVRSGKSLDICHECLLDGGIALGSGWSPKTATVNNCCCWQERLRMPTGPTRQRRWRA